jgi:hypothetical protein
VAASVVVIAVDFFPSRLLITLQLTGARLGQSTYLRDVHINDGNWVTQHTDREPIRAQNRRLNESAQR